MDNAERFNVVISPRAKQALGCHIAFVASASPEAALALKDALLRAMRSLEELPYRYPFFNEPYVPQNKYRKMFVQKHYLIIYQIKDKNVYIDHIADCREDYQWLLR